MDIPSTKHGPHHACAYCQFHLKYNSDVPSVDRHGFISTWNLLHLLCALGIASADDSGNSVLAAGVGAW